MARIPLFDTVSRRILSLLGGTPASIGTANAQGTATSLANSDHVHNHGNQSTSAHHALATVASANGFAPGFTAGTDRGKACRVAPGSDALEYAALSDGTWPAATASVPGLMSAADQIRLYGTDAAAVSIPTGAGYVTIQSTAALLVAKNTSRKVGFSVTLNQALANHSVRGDDLVFQVSWLDDDTCLLQHIGGRVGTAGATSTVTSTLATDLTIGFQAVYTQATQILTIAILRDAVIARSGQSSYWARTIRTQVAP